MDFDRDTIRAHLGMLLRAVIVGLSFSVVGLLQDGLPPLLLTALRFVIAALALLPLMLRASDRRVGLTGLILYGTLGACQAAFFAAMFWAAHRTTALSMTVLYVIVPFLAYCLGRVFGVEPARKRLLGILTIGAIGALGLAWANRPSAGLQFGAAEAGYFAGCVGIALYPVLSKWGLSRKWLSQSPSVRTFWSLVFGGILVACLGLIEESPQALTKLSFIDVLWLVYLGVLSTGATFWLMQRATAALSPGAMTAYAYVPPFVSMLLLFVTEPQSISWRWLPGALLVLAAIVLLLRLDADRNSSSRSDVSDTDWLRTCK
jgi:drug/metabolite transporter (DMT)-like permease